MSVRWLSSGDDGVGLAASAEVQPPRPADRLRRFLASHRTATDAEVAQIASLIFESMCTEAEQLADSPLSGPVVRRAVLSRTDLADAIGGMLSRNLLSEEESALGEALTVRLREPGVLRGVVADLAKAVAVDPAVEGMLQPAFFFKGQRAVAAHRCAHSLWAEGGAAERCAALYLQARISQAYGVDVHPAARLGVGLFVDHATAIVIGATSIIGDDVQILHGVTLGATGRPMGDAARHPTIERGATLGAGCTVLGPITVGRGANIGAQAVVTRDVPAGGTGVGVNRLTVRSPEHGACDFTWMYHRGGEDFYRQRAIRGGRSEAPPLGMGI